MDNKMEKILDKNNDELWKKITEENVKPFYLVSSRGRIMSDIGNGYKEITPQKNNYNQKIVSLASNDPGKPLHETVGNLVAKYFVPNPHGFNYVKFKDGNPENCKAENLEWVDRTDRQKNMYKQMEKKVNRFSIEGDYIESFDSITIASLQLMQREEIKSMKSATSSISLACRQHKVYAGTQWRFDSECSKNNKIKPYRKKHLSYTCFDKDTKEVVGEFRNIDEIAVFLNKPVSIIQANIHNCGSGRRPTAYGYLWKLNKIMK